MWNKTYVLTHNISKLHDELRGSIALYGHLQGDGDSINITLTAVPSAAEEAALDAVMAAHTAVVPSPPVIETLTPEQFADFRDIDYTILPTALHAVRVFSKGELQSVTWYTDNTLAKKVLKVDIVYSRDPFGFVTFRVTTRTWYNDDGTENPLTSVRTKHYDELGKQGEVKKRRENNVLSMQSQTLAYMVATGVGGDPLAALALGKTYMDTLDTEINKYIKSGSPILSTAILSNTVDTWLDNIIPGDAITIRDFMLAELS